MLNNKNNIVPTPPYEKGFTLAEVLITLVIIGVIAAITVPSLINKTNNQETVSRLKKVYSTLAQATNQIISENGPVKTWLDQSANDNDISNLYKSKLINTKDCPNKTGCFTQGDIKFLNSSSQNWDSGSYNTFILQDGTQILFSIYNNSCNIDNTADIGSKDVCFVLYADINGEKHPNTIGRDIFAFVVKNNGLYPAGCDYENLCTKNKKGNACTCKVLREGNINY